MRVYDGFRPTFEDRDCWTLPWILRERARTHGDRVFLEVPGQAVRMTYAATLAAAEAVASGFLADGLEPGDRVVIMGANSCEYLLAWFGSALAGLVEVPMNTAYTGRFLEHQVGTVAPRAAVADAAFVTRLLEDSRAYETIELVYVIGDGEEAEAALRAAREAGVRAAPFEALVATPPAELPAVGPRDLAAIFFTSGTTGLSKGVMMTHSHLAFFADQGVAMTRLTEADVYMSVGPLFHGNAQFLAVYPAMLVGARAVVQQRFSASRWLTQLRTSGVTVTNFIGVMMDFVSKQPPTEHDRDNALRCVYCVPTPNSILEPFKARFGIEAFVESLGSTEASLPILAPYGEDRPAGAAGLLISDWFEARIVDPETDVEVATGEVGEFVTRPLHPWTMCSGYYGMPDKTAEAFRNLWFHTGDAARRDAGGWYYFVDRLKDAIRRRGENISSFELEQAILAHPSIADCAAVATPAASEAGEDEVAIFVVPAAQADLTIEEVRAWCDEQLPAFARPETIRIETALPYTPSGKVRKHALREALTSATPAGT